MLTFIIYVFWNVYKSSFIFQINNYIIECLKSFKKEYGKEIYKLFILTVFIIN